MRLDCGLIGDLAAGNRDSSADWDNNDKTPGERCLSKQSQEENQGSIPIKPAPYQTRILARYDRPAILGDGDVQRPRTRLVAADGTRLYFSACFRWLGYSASCLERTRSRYRLSWRCSLAAPARVAVSRRPALNTLSRPSKFMVCWQEPGSQSNEYFVATLGAPPATTRFHPRN
jgi:hypothetical protein